MTTTINLFRRTNDVELFAAGETIFALGSPADQMYVIAAGEVRVANADGLIATLSVGEVLGEIAFLDGGPRTATAVALTDCALAPIDRKRFAFMVQHTPHFAQQMLTVLAERLRQERVTR